MTARTAFAFLSFFLVPGWATAEVLDSSPVGFTVKIVLTIQATPDDVYRKLVHNVGDWWNSGHTFSGNSHSLTIDNHAPGCFCEKLPNLGTVRHMDVVMAAPGERLVLNGALGPLQTVAATGAMNIQLAPAEGATKLVMTYAVAGYLPAGLNTWAAPVNSVLTEQFTRLKNFVERGDPAATADRPKAP